MRTGDISSHEMSGQRNVPSANTLVQCDSYATAVSIKEMEEVVMACGIPMTKLSYRIYDRNERLVKEGSYEFPEGGVNRFVLKDVLPISELQPYETKNADYRIETSVTRITGDEVSRYYTFKSYLRTGETTTEVPEKNFPERLAAIPIAKPGMTEEELRNICLDYLKLEVQFPFKFEEDFVYGITGGKRPRRLIGGKVYAGIPYVTRGAGNLYRIAEIYDTKTGALDPKSDLFDDIRYFGNACSGGASMAWARVVTSAYLGYTMFMSEANGFLPVGPYRYPKENVTRFDRDDPNGFNCATICSANGEQTMYESYALMKPADGVGCCGHVRMNSAVPTVVRKDDGTIDGDQSYTLMSEQVCYMSHINHLRIAPDGTHYSAQGYVDRAYTFRELFEGNYIPFTFAEFLNPGRVEPARIRLAVEPELKTRVLTCNYPISDVFIELNGKRYTYRNMEFFRKEVKMGDIFPEEILTKDAKISCQLLNGELLEVAQ